MPARRSSLTRRSTRSIDLTELQRASDFFDQQVSQLVEQDSKLQEVIKKLEELYQQAEKFPSFSKKPTEEQKKDEKVVYIEAFLKRQEDEEKS